MISDDVVWKIPLFDTNFAEPERRAVDQVLRSGWITMGDQVREFEERFAAFIGVRHAIAVSSCTAALHLANEALGIGSGDEVVCPSMTFVAGANTILQTGAEPVFADITSVSNFGISPADVETKITPRTKAIQVLHYGGAPCDMDGILDIAARHGLSVIEDCAHAPGAKYNGTACGAIGDIGCFSFFSNKNMTTAEGGMLTTNNDDIAGLARRMRSHGMTSMTLDRHRGRAVGYDVVNQGFNYRMDELRGAMGLVQLGRLPDANRRRRNIFDRYEIRLAPLNEITMVSPDHRPDNVCHILPIVLDEEFDRDGFMTALRRRGVQSSVHYPPSHLFGYYREKLGCGPGDLPVSESAARREVTLPLYPSLRDRDVDYVCDAVADVLASGNVVN